MVNLSILQKFHDEKTRFVSHWVVLCSKSAVSNAQGQEMSMPGPKVAFHPRPGDWVPAPLHSLLEVALVAADVDHLQEPVVGENAGTDIRVFSTVFIHVSYSVEHFGTVFRCFWWWGTSKAPGIPEKLRPRLPHYEVRDLLHPQLRSASLALRDWRGWPSCATIRRIASKARGLMRSWCSARVPGDTIRSIISHQLLLDQKLLNQNRN